MQNDLQFCLKPAVTFHLHHVSLYLGKECKLVERFALYSEEHAVKSIQATCYEGAKQFYR